MQVQHPAVQLDFLPVTTASALRGLIFGSLILKKVIKRKKLKMVWPHTEIRTRMNRIILFDHMYIEIDTDAFKVRLGWGVAQV